MAAEIATPKELDAILDAGAKTTALDARDRAMIWLMYRHGLRLHQVIALERRDYDAEKRTLVVRGQKLPNSNRRTTETQRALRVF
jgi:integrase